MMLCLTCGLQKPNYYKQYTCPICTAPLHYVEAAAKPTIIKFYRAGLYISYATSEVYSYNNFSVHTACICIGLAQQYPAEVFCTLPTGYAYISSGEYTYEYRSRMPLEEVLSPVRTYGQLRYEAEYLDYAEAKAVLKQKLKELDSWIDEAASGGWLTICRFVDWIY